MPANQRGIWLVRGPRTHGSGGGRSPARTAARTTSRFDAWSILGPRGAALGCRGAVGVPRSVAESALDFAGPGGRLAGLVGGAPVFAGVSGLASCELVVRPATSSSILARFRSKASYACRCRPSASVLSSRARSSSCLSHSPAFRSRSATRASRPSAVLLQSPVSRLFAWPHRPSGNASSGFGAAPPGSRSMLIRMRLQGAVRLRRKCAD